MHDRPDRVSYPPANFSDNERKDDKMLYISHKLIAKLNIQIKHKGIACLKRPCRVSRFKSMDAPIDFRRLLRYIRKIASHGIWTMKYCLGAGITGFRPKFQRIANRREFIVLAPSETGRLIFKFPRPAQGDLRLTVAGPRDK